MTSLSVALVRYTPRALHTSSLQDRAALASLGFPFLPATSRSLDERLDERRNLLTRHHTVPRTTWFAPIERETLPVSSRMLSSVAAVQQLLTSGEVGDQLLAWRHQFKHTPPLFTGRTVFLFKAPTFDDRSALPRGPNVFQKILKDQPGK